MEHARVEVDGDVATLVNGGLRVVVTAYDSHWKVGQRRFGCRVRFQDADDRELLSERDSGGALALNARRYDAVATGGGKAALFLESPADEKLVGMGLYQQDHIDLKGCSLELAHRNSQASVPFVISSAGYRMLWHSPSIGRATFARNGTEWSAESARQIDYWVTAGETPAQITRAYADATGHAPVMPERGLGFWQCKLRYASQDELLEVAREHHRRGLPLDVIVADFFHWPAMGDFRFEEEFWPDPSGMVDELRQMGVELMVSVWPQVALTSENFDEKSRLGLLVRSNRGIDVQMWFEGPEPVRRRDQPQGTEVPVGQAPGRVRPARYPHLLAGRGRARIRAVRLRRLPQPRRPGGRGRQPIPAGVLPRCLRGPAGRRRDRHRQPGALRVGRQPALRGARLVGRHPLVVGVDAQADPRGHPRGDRLEGGLADPGEWIAAKLEFPYEISRIVIVFADVPKQLWLVETSTDTRVFQPLHASGPHGEELSVRLEFEPRRASTVRLTFPESPVDVEEIRAY